MALTLATAVYTAHHGYAWSGIPAGMTEAQLDALLRLATERRPEFPDESAVDRGLVSDGTTAAAYTVRCVPNWDSEGRTAEYAALAVFPASIAADLDLAELLKDPFFNVPSPSPAPGLTYTGPASRAPAVNAPGRLITQRRLDDLDVHAAGRLLATYAFRSSRWSFRLNDDGATLSVETAPWQLSRSPTSH